MNSFSARMLISGFILISIFTHHVASHGRMIDPPNRSSVWRYQDTNPNIIPYKSIVEANYNDLELFCGGFQYQQNLGGKCGICGDPFDKVRENEAGGKYGKGIIVEQYTQGSLINVKVELTANHLGFFEFRLCVWNNPTVPGTKECLDQNLLQFADGSTQFFVDSVSNSPGMFEVNLQLPQDITCSQCILQWRYHAGNTWSCVDGECCTGCGPQEEFYGCADIAIGDGPILPPPNWNEPPPTSTIEASSTSGATTTEATTNLPPTTTVSETTTTASPSSGTDCEGKQINTRYKRDCDSFYTCGMQGEVHDYDCPPGTVFDEGRGMCDYAYNVLPPCGTLE